jgi:hypothetical protein
MLFRDDFILALLAITYDLLVDSGTVEDLGLTAHTISLGLPTWEQWTT